MKRIGASVVLLLATVVTSSLPAQAKGITQATFTGPGLPPSGIMIRTDPENGGGSQGQVLMEGLSAVFEEYRLDAPPVPTTDLGPQYRATIAFDFAPRLLRVTLYPYAEGGPVMFIPAGQKLGPEFEVPTLSSGWTVTATTFLDTLRKLGFPRTDPGTEPATTQTVPLRAEPGRATSSSAWATWLIVCGVATMLVATGLMVHRSRHRATAA